MRGNELEEARAEVRRVATTARLVAERIRADARAGAALVGRASSPVLVPARGEGKGQPGRNPRSPLIARRKPVESAGVSPQLALPSSVGDALVKHLTAEVGLPHDIVLQYAAALVASGHTTVDDFASLSLNQLQLELGFKAGHIKQVQQYRQQFLLSQALLDRHANAWPEQRVPAGLSRTPSSPTLSDSENHMATAARREQGFQTELTSLREDLGAVLGELSSLKASHAELEERQQRMLDEATTPLAQDSRIAREAVDTWSAEGNTVHDPFFHLHTEKLQAAWLEVDTRREGSLTESDVTNVLQRLGMSAEGSDLSDAMTGFDEHGNSTIDFQEFLDWYREAGPQLSLLPRSDQDYGSNGEQVVEEATWSYDSEDEEWDHSEREDQDQDQDQDHEEEVQGKMREGEEEERVDLQMLQPLQDGEQGIGSADSDEDEYMSTWHAEDNVQQQSEEEEDMQEHEQDVDDEEEERSGDDDYDDEDDLRWFSDEDTQSEDAMSNGMDRADDQNQMESVQEVTNASDEDAVRENLSAESLRLFMRSSTSDSDSAQELTLEKAARAELAAIRQDIRCLATVVERALGDTLQPPGVDGGAAIAAPEQATFSLAEEVHRRPKEDREELQPPEGVFAALETTRESISIGEIPVGLRQDIARINAAAQHVRNRHGIDTG